MSKKFTMLNLLTAILLSSLITILLIVFGLTSGIGDRKNVVGNKETAIEIARAIIEENDPSLFEVLDKLYYLDAGELKRYWVVYTYTDINTMGKVYMIQISKKTGEVIRMFMT